MKAVAISIALIVAALTIGCASEANKHHNKGVELGDQGRWEEAIAELDIAIELEGDPRSYAARGTAYGALNDFDRALADFDKAIELDPGLFNAYSERGAVYFLLGEQEKAAADLETALSLTDDDSERAFIKVLIEEVGGELPAGELSPSQCQEAASVQPGGIITFEGLTQEEILECAQLIGP